MSGTPRLRTTRQMIRGVADAWRKQYGGGAWRSVVSGNSEDIWNRLGALDVETATPEDVAKIIGNDSWTTLRCDQCGRYVDAVVELGEEPDYESRTADICVDCLRDALALAESGGAVESGGTNNQQEK